MRVLIGNMVKTDTADYPCSSREEAEALFMTLQERQATRTPAPKSDRVAVRKAPQRAGKARRP